VGETKKGFLKNEKSEWGRWKKKEEQHVETERNEKESAELGLVSQGSEEDAGQDIVTIREGLSNDNMHSTFLGLVLLGKMS
jgi:hypothetical protein